MFVIVFFDLHDGRLTSLCKSFLRIRFCCHLPSVTQGYYTTSFTRDGRSGQNSQDLVFISLEKKLN